MRLSGFPGMAHWRLVPLTFMTGFTSRFTTALHWMLSFVGRSRGERALTDTRID